MSAHASLVLARENAKRLVELLNETGNFPDAAESIDLVLQASAQPFVAIVTTTNRIGQMREWLQRHETDPAQLESVSEALRHALDFPFYEEHFNTSSST